MAKRIISMLLCLVMLSFALVACKKGGDNGAETSAAPQEEISTGGGNAPAGEGAETTWETDENGYVKDNIPDVDLGGRRISILAWANAKNWSIPDNGEGNDAIKNEVYLRTLDLKERLNITLEPVYAGSSAQNKELYEKATLAGEAEYDLIESFSLYPSMIAQQGMLLNLYNYTFPQFEMPWWPESLDNWSQYNCLFFAADNSSIAVIHSIETMYVNLSMLADYGINDLLTTVIDGDWTLDKLYAYTGHFSGSSQIENEDERTYGLVVDDFSRMDAFYYSAGFNSTRNDKSGKAELAYASVTDEALISDWVDKMITIMQRPEATIAKNTKEAMYKKQTAFMVCAMGDIVNMEADLSYAAIPVPKLDEDQEEYKAINNNGYDVWAIPMYAKDPETSGIVLEAFASSDYRVLAPFFYEKYLKGRYAVSWQGAEIYDMIRESIIYDFGRVSAFSLSVPEGLFRSCFWDGTEEVNVNKFSTNLANKNGNRQLEVQLRELVDVYRELANRQ